MKHLDPRTQQIADLRAHADQVEAHAAALRTQAGTLEQMVEAEKAAEAAAADGVEP